MAPILWLAAVVVLALAAAKVSGGARRRPRHPRPQRQRRKRAARGRRTSMAGKRAFISFDFDHDEDLRTLLVGQAKNPDTPFEITDWSVKEAMTGDWKEKARRRIRQVDLVIVVCGEYTHTATGVSAELNIARDEKKPYFLLW